MTHEGLRTLITAHAGSENTRANALEGIEKLYRLGADCIEVDARSGEGGIYLSHDELVPGIKYDSLENLFNLAAKWPDALFNVDLKHIGLARSVVDMAVRSHVKCLLTGSIADDDIPFLKRAGATVWYNAELLSEREREDPLGAVREKGFAVLNVNYRWITEDMLRDNADRLSVWTVDDEETLIRFLKAGVKNITTRHPLLAKELRSSIQG